MRCHFKHKTYRYKAHILFFALLCTITSCTREDNISATLDRAEMFMQEQPDSALVLLKGIDADGLKTEVQKARYALLYTQALEKNDLPIPGDSLINTAVRYYERGDNAHYKGLAYLYRGVAYKQMDSIALAFNSYARAAEEVDRERDGYTYGLTQSYMGVLYSEQSQNESALDFYRNAIVAFEDAGHWQNVYYCMGKLGDLFYLSDMADSAAYYYSSANKMAAERNDTSYIYYMDIARAMLMRKHRDYAGSKSLLLEIANKHNGGAIPEKCYSDLGYSYLGLRQLDSARYYVQLALQNPALSAAEYTWNLSLIQEIARQERDWEEAFGHLMQYVRAKDSIWQVRYKQDVRNIETNYLKKSAEYERYILGRKNLMYVLLSAVLFLLLIILSFLGFKLFEFWKKRQALREQERVKRYAATQQLVHRSITTQWDVQLFLAQYRSIQCDADEEAFHADILNVADTRYTGFTHLLKGRTPSLSNAELCLACLLFSGIKGAELRKLCHVPRDKSMQTRCYRLYKKMGIQIGKGSTKTFREVLLALYESDFVSQ